MIGDDLKGSDRRREYLPPEIFPAGLYGGLRRNEFAEKTGALRGQLFPGRQINRGPTFHSFPGSCSFLPARCCCGLEDGDGHLALEPSCGEGVDKIANSAVAFSALELFIEPVKVAAA